MAVDFWIYLFRCNRDFLKHVYIYISDLESFQTGYCVNTKFWGHYSARTSKLKNTL